MGLNTITLEDCDDPVDITALTDAQLLEELTEARAVIDFIKDSVHYSNIDRAAGLIFLQRMVTNMDILDCVQSEQKRRMEVKA